MAVRNGELTVLNKEAHRLDDQLIQEIRERNALRSKRGQPPPDPEKLEELLILVAQGASVEKVCKRDDMPSLYFIYSLMREMPQFAAAVSRARLDQAETLANQVVDIADELAQKTVITREDVEVAKIRIEARKWFASQRSPEVWGSAKGMTHSGGNVTITINSINPQPQTLQMVDIIEDPLL